MARFGGSRRGNRVGGFPGGTSDENSPTDEGDVRDVGSILGLRRSPGEGNGNPLQYSCLGKSHRQRSLAGCSPWGCKESDMTEHTHNKMKKLKR